MQTSLRDLLTSSRMSIPGCPVINWTTEEEREWRGPWLWGQRGLPCCLMSSATSQLCDLGQATCTLWTSFFFFTYLINMYWGPILGQAVFRHWGHKQKGIGKKCFPIVMCRLKSNNMKKSSIVIIPEKAFHSYFIFLLFFLYGQF